MEHRIGADETARVLIVSAYRPLRDALREILAGEPVSIVGESGTARQGLALLPDVAVLDERLPDGDAHTLSASLHGAASPTRCIILSSWHPHCPLPTPGDPVLLLRQIADNGLAAAIRSAASRERSNVGPRAPNLPSRRSSPGSS